jgi:hypothetical protein
MHEVAALSWAAYFSLLSTFQVAAAVRMRRARAVRGVCRNAAKSLGADTAREATFNCSLNENRSKEGECDCHLDVARAAFVTPGDLLRAGA